MFKYFVKFDEQGEIGCFCKEKPSDCFEECKEYLIKLIPINRQDSTNEFTKSADMFVEQTNKLTSEIKKVRNKLRRSFK